MEEKQREKQNRKDYWLHKVNFKIFYIFQQNYKSIKIKPRT